MSKRNSAKRITGIIFSVAFIAVFLFGLIWAIINWETVKQSLSGTQLYTAEQVEQIKQQSYNEALKDKDSYLELINSLRDEKTNLTDELSQAKNNINSLKNSNQEYQTNIELLTEQKIKLESDVANLQAINNQNENNIASLNSQVSVLQKEVENLTTVGEEKDNLIVQKNIQISNLQETINQLHITNELNNQSIISLNNQIKSLNTQIAEMTTQVQNNSSIVSSLNKKIADLEKSLAYYEQYIVGLETDEQVVATFEFDGSVYNIQILNKNSTASVANPQSTDYVIFNYWTVNDEKIDLATYSISTNTKFVANVTYRYDVKFIVDDLDYDSQIVTLNDTPDIPIEPVKEGYQFDGWSLNGIDIIENIVTEVTGNITYYAVFTKIHTVTFVDNSEILSTQSVRNGEYCDDPDNPVKVGYVFKGWSINNFDIIDVSNFKIMQQTIFFALWSVEEYTVEFRVDENLIETQKVEYGHFAVQPTSINNLKGWSVNGFDIIDVTTYEITENTIFLAILYENITLFSGEKEVVNVENAYSENICNAEYNLNFDNLLTTDKIIVTFSVVGIFIGPDQAEPTYYWNGEGFSLSSSSVGDLIVNSEENFFVENLYYVNGAYIKINCLNNGILTIQTSGGYVDCGFTKLTISKIEILR